MSVCHPAATARSKRRRRYAPILPVHSFLSLFLFGEMSNAQGDSNFQYSPRLLQGSRARQVEMVVE
jgi:hypothetical protein